MVRHEQIIRDKALPGENKRAYRTQHSEPIVQAFWQWCDQQCHRLDLHPKDLLSKALNYAKARRISLQVFLSNPNVPIDTNHLERSLRPIPMGRKNWLFCWTEMGAERVGIIQSLLVTCKLHNIDHLDLESLYALNDRIIERIKFLEHARAHLSMIAFNIGAHVSFETAMGRQFGRLVKYNQKTVNVDTEDGRRWRISPHLLSQVKEVPPMSLS
jgi:hypothetical protein